MNKIDQKTVSTRGSIAIAVYYLLNILLFPITLIGYVLMTVSFIAGRKSGVSGTALAPLTGRWLLHNLGSRQDEPANRLMMAMAGLSVSLTEGAMIFAHRVSGYVPKDYRYPFQGEITLGNQGGARQTLYDNVVEQYLPGITQFVILGAGFDTRALRLQGTLKYAPVRSFEIDTPPTLAYKREKLARAGIELDRGHLRSCRLREGGLAHPVDQCRFQSRPARAVHLGGRNPIPGSNGGRGHTAQDRQHCEGQHRRFRLLHQRGTRVAGVLDAFCAGLA